MFFICVLALASIFSMVSSFEESLIDPIAKLIVYKVKQTKVISKHTYI